MDDNAARVERSGGVRSVSMTDVAQRAGVSQKTVSRVVRDEPNVTAAVRDRVNHAIQELGFRPNAAARALKMKQSSRRIGMLTLGSVLHGTEDVSYPEGPLRVGDDLSGEVVLTEVEERSGRSGPLRIVTFVIQLFRPGGETAVTIRRSLVILGQADPPDGRP